jgi:uncharacterized protein (TIGR03000 family)
MIKRLVLVPAILSIVGLLMAADSAFAQRGGGHGGGGHGGGGHGGGWSGGGHGGGHYGGHGGGYYGGGFYGGGYYGGLGLYGYDPWYDSYSYPRYSYYSAPAVQYYDPPAQYYDPPTQYYAPPAPVVNDYANVRVIVPDPQARVWFDGNGTSQGGADRLFHTPSLTMGSTYKYQIRASWMQGGREVTQERSVSVTPGQTAMVDFSR